MGTSLEIVYHCPGESYPIERAVHLARLLDGYAACGDCAHRGDTHSLSHGQVGQISRLADRPAPAELFNDETIAGVYLNELRPSEARRVGLALGTHLRADADIVTTRATKNSLAASGPRVVVGRDGRPLTAELLAAASEGLRLAGCRVIEIGDVTAACLAAAIVELKADGGLLVGNAVGQPQTASLKLWGRHAEPFSAGPDAAAGELDAIRRLFAAGANRPVRHGGGAAARHSAEGSYLARLAGLFHALRPLRFVLDTSSLPLADYLQKLLRDSACEVLPPGKLPTPSAGERRKPPAHPPRQPTFLERRMRLLSHTISAERADFGLWIDGDAEVCRLVDERGAAINGERLTLVLADWLLQQQPGAAVAIERESSPSLAAAIARRGGVVAISAATRDAMYATLAERRAILGGGPSGRLWFGADPPVSDALLVLSLLLAILSHSDLPLSEVLDAAAIGE